MAELQKVPNGRILAFKTSCPRFWGLWEQEMEDLKRQAVMQLLFCKNDVVRITFCKPSTHDVHLVKSA